MAYPSTSTAPPRSPAGFRPFLDAFIERHLDDPCLGTAQLCAAFLLSRSELYRRFKAHTGTSVNRYIRQKRLERAFERLASREGETIEQIAFDVGFSDPSYFCRSFKAAFAMTPRQVGAQ